MERLQWIDHTEDEQTDNHRANCISSTKVQDVMIRIAVADAHGQDNDLCAGEEQPPLPVPPLPVLWLTIPSSPSWALSNAIIEGTPALPVR